MTQLECISWILSRVLRIASTLPGKTRCSILLHSTTVLLLLDLVRSISTRHAPKWLSYPSMCIYKKYTKQSKRGRVLSEIQAALSCTSLNHLGRDLGKSLVQYALGTSCLVILQGDSWNISSVKMIIVVLEDFDVKMLWFTGKAMGEFSKSMNIFMLRITHLRRGITHFPFVRCPLLLIKK